jgi:diphosphomevalonate decarboxylase
VEGFLSQIHVGSLHAQIESENNFPTGAGAASSASGFSALALAASTAAGLHLTPRELSILARTGSGSAARSVFGGVVRLHAGVDSESSFAEQVFPVDYWPLIDLIAIVNPDHKSVGSTHGHALAETSPLQTARISNTPSRLKRVLEALETQDFETLADVCELDSNMMHAVMLTSSPPLLYWTPATVAIMQTVREWRARGDPVFYTIDAGPNVHCLTLPQTASRIRSLLEQLPGTIQVLEAGIGKGARLIT